MPFLRRRGITPESEMRRQSMVSAPTDVVDIPDCISSQTDVWPLESTEPTNAHNILLQQQLYQPPPPQQQQLMNTTAVNTSSVPKGRPTTPVTLNSALVAVAFANNNSTTPTLATITAASVAAVAPIPTVPHPGIPPLQQQFATTFPRQSRTISTRPGASARDEASSSCTAINSKPSQRATTMLVTQSLEGPSDSQFMSILHQSPIERPKTPSQEVIEATEDHTITPDRHSRYSHNPDDPDLTPVAYPPSAAIHRGHDITSPPRVPRTATENAKYRRFSLRFRNASDSQLSLRMKQQAEPPPPPVPIPPPDIITTAPTIEFAAMQKKPSRLRLSRFRPAKNSQSIAAFQSASIAHSTGPSPGTGSGPALRNSARALSSAAVLDSHNNPHRNFSSGRPSEDTSPESINNSSLSPARAALASNDHDMAPDGTFFNMTPYRRSTSSRPSDVSFADPRPLNTNQRSASSLFRLPRRKTKNADSLFPLGHLPQKPKLSMGDDSHFESDASNSLMIPGPDVLSSSLSTENPLSKGCPNTPRPRPMRSKTATPNMSPLPATALFRPQSNHSGRSSPTRSQRRRGRSSTLSSLGHDSNDEHLAPPNSRPSFNSGRKSFGDLFGLNRLRQNSELAVGRSGNLTPATPGSVPSKNNSLQLVREEVSLPEKRDEDTPVKYLARVEEVIPRGSIASALSKSSDAFYIAVLRSYMRKFSFFGDPMDMALRKLLMEAELPKETQQIDRCLVAFANRYHECNPGIYANPDQAYFVAFSLLILHTDVFNKNNKHKMQKADYLKNTREQGVYDDILDCFYDNITYTPFIHVEDDFDSNSDRQSQGKGKRRPIFPGAPPELQTKKNKEPIDPYTLILDGKLDTLRPNFKDVMNLEDNYNYLGSAKHLDLKELQKTFFRTGVLQIVSARSRPDAFMTEKTASNPQVAHPGIVDIKVTKVGLLWRKDAKKKKTRSPWQEWGAILTGAQLYFFRNTTWVKSLMHQYEFHMKQGNDDVPVIFKPPLEQFKPDALMSTDGAVALHDASYKKHKHAFVYIRHGGFEEVLLADDENEMNDWLAKLNYAAAFKTSGVRMRGVVGANYDGQNRRAIRRLDSADGAQVVQTPSGEVSITRGRIDHKMAEDISAARRQIIVDKVAEANERLGVSQKLLDLQLRNARHLQIMAPIQAKTREQVLLSAARMSAQLKWTRAEIWRLKCHRDILIQDMEEERLLLSQHSPGGLGLIPVTENSSAAADQSRPSTSTSLEERLNQIIIPGSSHGHSNLSLDSSHDVGPSAIGSDVIESDDDEDFTTPPTSVTQQRPRSNTASSARKQSVVSVKSSQATTSSVASPPVTATVPDDSNKETSEDDIVEHDLLEQAGLLRSSTVRHRMSTGSNAQLGAIDVDPDKEKADRSKIRRSLQKTLREGGSRTKKGKEPIPSEPEDERLARGTGSFTVHGKKASVINFGSELHNLPSKRTESELPTPPSVLSIAEDSDFHSALGDFDVWRERRGSGASASTATARSFRELHRKYSTNGPRTHSTPGNGRLALLSDTESEIAVSFSEGRRTPLLLIENPRGDEAEREADVTEIHDMRDVVGNDGTLSEELVSNEKGTKSDAQGGDVSDHDVENITHSPIPPIRA